MRIPCDKIKPSRRRASAVMSNKPNLSALQRNGIVGRNSLVPGAFTGIPPDIFDVKLTHYLTVGYNGHRGNGVVRTFRGPRISLCSQLVIDPHGI